MGREKGDNRREGAGGARGAVLMMRVRMAAIFSPHVQCVPIGVRTVL